MKQNKKNKPESFAKYDQALDELKKRKRKSEETTNNVTDNKGSERREQPIRKATKKALVDIGKVY